MVCRIVIRLPRASFYVVTEDCSLKDQVTYTTSNLGGILVGDGQELRIRGSANVSHPVLDRGGVANGLTSVYFRHFVLDGIGSKLTLVNLK